MQAIIRKIRGIWISDAAHGWLKVDRMYLKFLGVSDKISHCSYVRGDFVYLEWDCDADIFINAAKDQGYEVITKENKPSNKSSKVRGYQSYEMSRSN